MITDYEELIHSINGDSTLINQLSGLVESFFQDNPKSVTRDVYAEWDELPTWDRLVFESPIPLAEEQRKIINALNKESARFVTVEGPPGTGKSHTITAAAFEVILKGKSILILSDKKEALDVVENKINETLSKIRPSDEFINPILRLGRSGSNYTKLTTKRSIENLRTQHPAVSG